MEFGASFRVVIMLAPFQACPSVTCIDSSRIAQSPYYFHFQGKLAISRDFSLTLH